MKRQSMRPWGIGFLARHWGALLLILAIFLLGCLGYFASIRGKDGVASRSGDSASLEKSAEAEQLWTCSMHPQILRKAPGRCPICGMDLMPVSKTVW